LRRMADGTWYLEAKRNAQRSGNCPVEYPWILHEYHIGSKIIHWQWRQRACLQETCSLGSSVVDSSQHSEPTNVHQKPITRPQVPACGSESSLGRPFRAQPDTEDVVDTEFFGRLQLQLHFWASQKLSHHKAAWSDDSVAPPSIGANIAEVAEDYDGHKLEHPCYQIIGAWLEKMEIVSMVWKYLEPSDSLQTFSWETLKRYVCMYACMYVYAVFLFSYFCFYIFLYI
jgi:hypothetical protein